MSEEEKLAAAALQKIHLWLEKEKEFRGEDFVPRLAIKFCGGCNPVIERAALAQIIRENLSEGAQWVSGEEEVDFLLIIEGCLTGCADRPEIRERARTSLTIQNHAVSEVEKHLTAESAEKNTGKLE